MKRARRLCRICRRRRALTRIRGRYRFVRHHDACRQCWRSRYDSARASQRGRVAA
jgi:hypothetical protein